MILQDYSQLRALRELYSQSTIAVCSGTFDLGHAGHGLFFEDCKRYCDVLVVQVGCDEVIRRYKREPIQNQFVRIKQVDLMKPVDYCILQDETESIEDDYLSGFFPVIENLNPNRWIFNADVKDIPRRIELAKKFNLELVVLERTCPKEFDGISTTRIIDKIKKS